MEYLNHILGLTLSTPSLDRSYNHAISNWSMSMVTWSVLCLMSFAKATFIHPSVKFLLGIASQIQIQINWADAYKYIPVLIVQLDYQKLKLKLIINHIERLGFTFLKSFDPQKIKNNYILLKNHPKKKHTYWYQRLTRFFTTQILRHL